MAGLDRREFLAAAAGGVAFTALPSELAAGQSGRLSRRAARALRSDVRGRVLLPGGRGYNAARLIYNLRYDGARPAAVVQPRDTRDVAAVVSWANRFDVRVVPRAGGHSYAGYSTTSRGVVLDLSGWRGVRVANGRATVGAGAQLIDMDAALARRGLTALGQFFGSEAALRRVIRPLARVGGARLSTGRFSMMALALRWAGCLDETFRACHTRGTSPGAQLPRSAFYAKSDYFNRPLSRRARRTMIDWVERRGSGALLFDAYGGAYNRPAADATAFPHRDMLFSLQIFAAGSGRGPRAWANGVWRALRPFASGQAYVNYIDPEQRGWQRAYYASNPPPPAPG